MRPRWLALVVIGELAVLAFLWAWNGFVIQTAICCGGMVLYGWVWWYYPRVTRQ